MIGESIGDQSTTAQRRSLERRLEVANERKNFTVLHTNEASGVDQTIEPLLRMHATRVSTIIQVVRQSNHSYACMLLESVQTYKYRYT